MSEKSLTEKIEERVTRIVEFIQNFLRRHPIVSLVLLSLLLIAGALLWNTTRESNSAQKASAGEEIQQEQSPQESGDFNQPQLPLTPDSYREQRAYDEYEKKIEKLEAETGEDIISHFDGSEEKRVEGDRFIRSLGGLYDLPYRGGGIQAKYMKVVESAAGTRYIIAIGYIHSLERARKEWSKYLRGKNDGGKYYITRYFRLPH